MAKAKKDIYVNRAFVSLTMSAANIITFQQLNFAVGVFQGIALKLVRIHYYIHSGVAGEMVLAADRLYMGMTLRDDLATLNPTNQSVIDQHFFALNANATAEAVLFGSPIVTDFSGLPEGGLLLPANPIYVAMVTAGFAAAGGIDVVLYYQFVQLSDREAIELLQTIIPGNV